MLIVEVRHRHDQFIQLHYQKQLMKRKDIYYRIKAIVIGVVVAHNQLLIIFYEFSIVIN